MIERISELPFFGPEEQIRKFICHNDEGIEGELTQDDITQARIGNIDEYLQLQLIWSKGKVGIDDAYFYWDWCPMGKIDPESNMWRLERWDIDEWFEHQENLDRDIDRQFSYKEFVGYTNSSNGDQMPMEYDSTKQDESALEQLERLTTLDAETLRHNIMRSYIEVSEWLGDNATKYGSHNGYVSRKMSMAWLFDAIRALINFKMANQDKYAEKDIYPLDVNEHHEGFLKNGISSDCGVDYFDETDIDQTSGRCQRQIKQRANNPDKDGVLKVRGNAWFYGERFWNYAHTSFMGECRFFHNARFFGQTTFDKEINGTAMRSRWASDICEYYQGDMELEPGTLIKFGGDNEVTIANDEVNGVVTTNPGFILNSEKANDKYSVGVVFAGKVPVKVNGVVHKFDKLILDSKKPGCAIVRKWYQWFKKPIAIALTEKPSTSVGLVDCVTKLSF